METITIPITEVHPLEVNPRRHPEKQLNELVRSLEQFGQYRPLVVDEDGVILAGNGLHAALLRTGATEVTVYRATGLSETQKKKLILSDNKTGDLSNDDFDVMEQMLRELEDFEVPGYGPEMLRGIIADAEDVLEDANSYGVLSDEDREGLLSHRDEVQEANAGASVGTAPEPPSDGTGPGSYAAALSAGEAAREEAEAGQAYDFTTGTPAGDALADAVETRKREGHVCPACGRGW